MICYSSLRKIISTYSFRPISSSYLVFLSLDLCLSFFNFSDSYNLALKIFRALALFLCWDFSSCWVTTIPDGPWVILTALSVVFTDWPPGPLDLKTSILRSLSLILISTSSASGSIATVAADVWTLPCASVVGTLWTRWTPDSYLR